MSKETPIKNVEEITNDLLSRKDLVKFIKLNIDSLNTSWAIRFNTPNKLWYGAIWSLKEIEKLKFFPGLVKMHIPQVQNHDHWTQNPRYQAILVLEYIIERLEEWIPSTSELIDAMNDFIKDKKLENAIVYKRFFDILFNIFNEVLCKEQSNSNYCKLFKIIIDFKNKKIRRLVKNSINLD